jgi:hypothetical protein
VVLQAIRMTELLDRPDVGNVDDDRRAVVHDLLVVE